MRMGSSVRDLIRSAGLFFMLLAIQASGAAGQSSWELKKEQDGIRVYVREVPDNPLKESKATVRFSGKVDDVVRLIFDFPNYTKWAPSIIAAKQV